MNHVAGWLLILTLLAAPASFAESLPQPMLGSESFYRAFVGADGVQHIAIDSGNYFFRPRHIIVRAHVPVELGVTLERGLVPHSFVLHAPEAGIEVDEKLGNDVTYIRFTPLATGRFDFYCKNKLLFLKSHREKGMEGILEVVE